MNGFKFWHGWLRAVALGITAFGVIMALFNRTPLFEFFNHNIDAAFWDELPEGAANFRGWVYAGWGATISGWGIALLFLASHAMKWKHRWAWNAAALGLVVWYVLDTFFSLYHGVIFNAVFNTVIALLAALPLAFTRNAMTEA